MKNFTVAHPGKLLSKCDHLMSSNSWWKKTFTFEPIDCLFSSDVFSMEEYSLYREWAHQNPTLPLIKSENDAYKQNKL